MKWGIKKISQHADAEMEWCPATRQTERSLFKGAGTPGEVLTGSQLTVNLWQEQGAVCGAWAWWKD